LQIGTIPYTIKESFLKIPPGEPDMAKVKIYVTFKEGILDPQGKTVKSALEKMGYANIEEVRFGKFIEIDTKDAKSAKLEKEVDQICDSLLANPNIEKYSFKIE
jgi:phosphoribosylformylglycinamidine synthase PurS subunit